MNPLRLLERILGPAPSDAGETPATGTPAALAGGGEVVISSPGEMIAEAARYPEAERIAASLRDYPGDWGWDQKGYTLAHKPTGFVLWVGNGRQALGERSSGKNSDFEKPEQEIVWPAVKAWLSGNRVGFTGRLPKVKITSRNGNWWCTSEHHPWAGAGGSPVEAYRSWARAVSIEARTDQRPGETLYVWSGAR